MIVWDINSKLKISNSFIAIFTPLFSLNSNRVSIRIVKYRHLLRIDSNLSSKKEFIRCTTYAINPKTCKILDVYKGFAHFAVSDIDFMEEMRFVLEVKMHCVSSPVQPIIWRHIITEARPEYNTPQTNPRATKYTRLDYCVYNRGVSGLVYFETIEHERLCDLALEKLDELLDATLEYYNANKNIFSRPRTSDYENMRINYTNDAFTLLAELSNVEIASIENTIKPELTLVDIAPNLELSKVIENVAVKPGVKKELNPTADHKELEYPQKFLSNLKEYFVANKFCDISIDVQGQRIRAHKTALAIGSTIWHDLIVKNEKLDTINITDFDYATVQELIVFMYTGNVNHVTDQLLIAADTFGVADLKNICEVELSKTIEKKNVAKLLMLADRYKAISLYDKVVDFIEKNLPAFMEMEETKGLCMTYPELSFKLLTRLSRK